MSILKEMGKSQKLSPEKLAEIEAKLDSNLAKTMGNNWATLPATGPYVLMLYLVMNLTLAPLGITPATVSNSVIDKAKELELDKKAIELLTSTNEVIKTTGDLTRDKIQEFNDYISPFIKSFGQIMNDVFKNTQFVFLSTLDSGKNIISKIFKKHKSNNNSNEINENSSTK